MMNKHAKSPCCGAPVRRYGNRRRQCINCNSTWRVRHKKRGRKQLRTSQSILVSVLGGMTTLAQRARVYKLTPDALEKRCQRITKQFLEKSAGYSFPNGTLILIIDGLWTYFHKEGRFTLYLLAVRGINDVTAHFLDPILLPGREDLNGWRQAMATIPDAVRQRIRAVISDGLQGLARIAEENGWLFQRCHFHLLAWFQKRHGQYFQRGKSKPIRDVILAYVQTMLETGDQKKLWELSKELETIIENPDCPYYLAVRIRKFLKSSDDFRTYLRYPELNLPTTSNTVETMIRLLRGLLSRIRGTTTPQAFIRWTTSYIRYRRTIICNGKNSTKINR